MRQLALTTAQQRRLERLAREAGRTSKAMLQFVLRDGFEACEEDVRENLAADAEFASGKSVAHKEAMSRARSAIESHAREAQASRLDGRRERSPLSRTH
jgi:predicted transcriptional regulator